MQGQPEDLRFSLKTKREIYRLTQAQVAAQAGISQMAVSLLERGKRSGRAETWKRLAGVFRLPVVREDK